MTPTFKGIREFPGLFGKKNLPLTRYKIGYYE